MQKFDRKNSLPAEIKPQIIKSEMPKTLVYQGFSAFFTKEHGGGQPGGVVI